MLDCGEILDIAQVTQWHASAMQQLANINGDITIDVSSLQKIDTAGIQLLTSIVRHVESRGNKVIWSELSPAFINAATLLGLHDTLGMKRQ